MSRRKNKNDALVTLGLIGGSALLIGALFGFTSGKVTFGDMTSDEKAGGGFSKYFNKSLVTKSNVAQSKGINNAANDRQYNNAQILARKVLDPIAQLSGSIPKIISWFRSPELNNDPSINGSNTSDHLEANAADIDNGGAQNAEFIRTILQHAIPFKQLIIYNDLSEPAWLHISFDPSKSADNQKHEILIKKNGSYTEIGYNEAQSIYL